MMHLIRNNGEDRNLFFFHKEDSYVITVEEDQLIKTTNSEIAESLMEENDNLSLVSRPPVSEYEVEDYLVPEDFSYESIPESNLTNYSEDDDTEDVTATFTFSDINPVSRQASFVQYEEGGKWFQVNREINRKNPWTSGYHLCTEII